MMKNLFVLIFISLCSWFYPISVYSKNIDAINKLINKGNELLAVGKYDSASIIYNIVLQIADKQKQAKSIAEATIYLGVSNDYQGKYDVAIAQLFKGMNLSEKIKDTILIRKASENLGVVYDNMGKFDMAIQFYKQSLKLSEYLHDSLNMAGTLHNLAGIMMRTEKLDSALLMVNNAYNINKKSGKLDWLTLNLSLMGNIFAAKKEYINAIEKFKKSVEISEKIDDTYGATIAYINIGDNLIQLKDFSNAEIYLNKALIITKSSKAYDFERGRKFQPCRIMGSALKKRYN